ncbi:MAG: MFS transporter [Chloroflexia bacterium]|nr:MFS transporter [Chloroflexia bacterium]
MSKKQLFSLFVGSLVLYVIGNGLLPLLPAYPLQFGGESVQIGYYLAFAYLALALGNIGAGWVSKRLQIRKVLFVTAGLLAIPGVWLMGMVTEMWQLVVLTAIVWFLIGVGLALMSILTGLFAKKEARGRVFAFLLAMPIGLGSLVGGLGIGPIAQKWGYPTMFQALSLFLLLWPATGLLLEDRVVPQKPPEAGRSAQRALPGPFFLLLGSNFLALSAYFSANFGRSLVMADLGFDRSAISSTAVPVGLVLLILPTSIGWLSDRLGRKWMLLLCYLVGSGGLVLLIFAAALWQFWVAFCLLALLVIGISVGSALVADLVQPESLDMAMSLFSASSFAGGVASFIATGYVLEALDFSATFALGALLPLLALLLALLVRQPRP